MLKHEDNPQIQTQPAAQVRVTPEELAAAVTALQIRKEGQPGTIPIGDAVEELGLEVSPEEVLAEVQAKQRTTLRKRRSFVWHRATLALGLGGVLLGLAVDGNEMLQAQSSPVAAGTAPYHVEPSILALNTASFKPMVTTLAEAPDGRTLYCSPHAIEVAAASRNDQDTQPEINEAVTEMNWPVVKYGKDLYVRGWTRVPLSKEAAKLSDVEVFNKPYLPQIGTNPQPVTIKLDGWAGLGYQRLNPNGAGVFVFHNPRLTVHAYEKW